MVADNMGASGWYNCAIYGVLAIKHQESHTWPVKTRLYPPFMLIIWHQKDQQTFKKVPRFLYYLLGLQYTEKLGPCCLEHRCPAKN